MNIGIRAVRLFVPEEEDDSNILTQVSQQLLPAFSKALVVGLWQGTVQTTRNTDTNIALEVEPTADNEVIRSETIRITAGKIGVFFGEMRHLVLPDPSLPLQCFYSRTYGTEATFGIQTNPIVGPLSLGGVLDQVLLRRMTSHDVDR